MVNQNLFYLKFTPVPITKNTVYKQAQYYSTYQKQNPL